MRLVIYVGQFLFHRSASLAAGLAVLLGYLGIVGCVHANGANLEPLPEPGAQAQRRFDAIVRTQAEGASEVHAYADDGSFRHPESGLSGQIDEGGSLRIGRARRQSVALTSWGRPGNQVEVQRAPPRFDRNLATVERGALRETFEHGPLSILHRIEVLKPPPDTRDARESSELRLNLSLGNLRAVSPDAGGPSAVLLNRLGDAKYHLGEIYVRDAKGLMLPASIHTLRRQIGFRIDDSRATYPIEVVSVFFIYQWRRVATLSPPFLVERPNYGRSVDISGVWAAVSAPSVAVDLWNRLSFLMGDIWELNQSISPRPNSGFGQFGARVALGGGRLAIGAPFNDINGVDLGYVDIYALDAGFGNWVYETTLIPANFPAGSTAEFGFGRSLDMDGSVLVVGANRFFGGRGLVFIFERSGSTWTQEAVFSGTPFIADANFGTGVHISGDTIAITQPGAGVMVNLPGSIIVYRRVLGVWTIEQTFSPNAGSGVPDYFGGSAALDGDWLWVRSDSEVLAYNRTGSSWSETWSAAASGSFIARYALSMGGNLVALGSPNAQASGISLAGDVGLYRRQADQSFLLSKTLKSSSPGMSGAFGFATAIDSGNVIVGEPGAERAYIYRLTSGLSLSVLP